MSHPPVFLEHPSSMGHDTGSHPEQAARLRIIERELDARGWLGFERVQSPAADRATVQAVHPERHIELIERLAEHGGAMIDADTIVSAGSFEAALHAAGGAVSLVDRLLDGSAPTGFSAHRPPGHHAETSRAMGFCLFNNVAIAARHAINAHGLDRVMIIDWDVHHGNGTDDIFHEDDQVLFLSIHESPLYPGTGDDVYRSLIEHVAAPVARRFAPQLLLISAGFDAHVDDPLADCCVTEAGYAAMAASLRALCTELGIPFGAVLEGGYALTALGRSVAATLEALGGPAPPPVSSQSGELAVADDSRRALARLQEFWPGIA
ncbi:MAG: histone deacetylase [Solirubrobacteraceae bacterium]